MVCSHCGETGHNFRTCPTISPEQRQNQINLNAQRRQIRRQNLALRQQQQQQQQQQQEQEQSETSNYEVINATNYEVVAYWAFKDNPTILRRFLYIGSHESKDINCIKIKHRIVIYPFLEVCNGGADAQKKINTEENEYTSVFDMNMEDFDGTTIIIDKKYEPKKTELEQWKECALKSKYLLDEIIKITGGVDEKGEVSKKEYENLAPMFDMVQDINIPNTCSEIDKERAGIPSTLTNIT